MRYPFLGDLAGIPPAERHLRSPAASANYVNLPVPVGYNPETKLAVLIRPLAYNPATDTLVVIG